MTLAFLLVVSLFGCASSPQSRPANPQSQVLPSPATAVGTSPDAGVVAQSDQSEFWTPPPAMTRGSRIALLLPMTGPYATTAEAARDGFLAEYFNAGAQGEVRVYDVGDSPEWLLRAYQQALNDGVDMIVGPLKKESVAQLAAMAPPVPVLGLNYMDAGYQAPFNFYQFGLAPEDEARAVADDAGSKRLLNAVALVPEGDWGTRVLGALDERLRQWGGRVISSGRYRQGVSDQKEVISSIMGVSASQERHNALTRALGERTEFEAGRRGDIDFIFIATRAQDARVLLPQFRFYRSSGLPQYATSMIYNGRPDAELASLRFCDMPFTVDSSGVWADERSQASRLPAVAAYPRLYALGADAYRVATALHSGRFRSGELLPGASGWMEWTARGTLTRRLECVEMRADGLVPTTAQR
ncbi:penicillin-binding protein activator [Sinimarinibacterium sp. CAU 1509]|uniref:penicillin-binding protein activator n=1 Tax=Sinimarinibacterium sp. CAU 1509 TaxID=2562283 RepID=UPI00146BE0FA|nr:penicillin-binding protein activator [Sinimarinibacterium sp. CAU 1509]